LIKKLRGIIEIDEVYLNSGLKGFKNIGRASRKRGLKRRGRGNFLSDKPSIFAIVSRKRRRIFSVEFNAETFFIQQLLNKYVSKNSLINTDDFPSSCESEFSILRPFMAVHRGVNKYHLHFYLACFALERIIEILFFLIFARLLMIYYIVQKNPPTTFAN
jgi:transposase-like protein